MYSSIFPETVCVHLLQRHIQVSPLAIKPKSFYIATFTQKPNISYVQSVQQVFENCTQYEYHKWIRMKAFTESSLVYERIHSASYAQFRFSRGVRNIIFFLRFRYSPSKNTYFPFRIATCWHRFNIQLLYQTLQPMTITHHFIGFR